MSAAHAATATTPWPPVAPGSTWRRLGHAAAQPADDRVGVRRQRQGAAPLLRRRRAGRVRHQVRHGRPAVGPWHAADGRDALAACSTRSACRGRASTRSSTTTCRGSKSVGARVAGLDRRQHAARSSPTSPPRCGRADAFDAVVGVEVNISCPNVANRGLVFACDPLASAKVIALVREQLPRDIPVFAKLSPDVTDIVEHRRGLRQGRRRRAHHDQHAARHGHRHRPDAAAARRDHRRPVRSGDPAGRRARHLAGARGDARGPAPDGADHRRRGSAHRRATPSSWSPRARARSRSAPRRSTTRAPRSGSCDELAGCRAAGASRGSTDAVGVAHEPGWTARPMTDRRERRLRRAPARARWRRTARCASASTRTPALLAAWGLPDDVAGPRAVRADLRRGVRGGRSPRSSRSRRSSSASARPAWRSSSGRSPSCADAGTLSLLDVKRGDIGSTMDGVRRGLPRDRTPAARPTRSPSAPTSATARCARRSTSPGTPGAGSSCSR